MNRTGVHVKAIDDCLISINICAPRRYVQQFEISCMQRIGTIQNLFPKEEKIFIYNGQLIDKERTFFDYGIQDNDSIVVLSNDTNAADCWMRLTRDSSLFRRNILSAINPRTANESARIRDLHLIRLEAKRKSFSRLMSLSMTQQSVKELPVSLNINYERSTEISDQPLPVPW